MRPHRPVLLRKMQVRVGNFRRQHQPVVFHAARFPQLLEPLGTEHFSERVRRIDRSVDEDVHDVNALRGVMTNRRPRRWPDRQNLV